MKRQVLKAFKDLHRARLLVFDNDTRALESARVKINEDFKKNKHVEDPAAIEELVKLAQDVEKELKTTVVQAEEHAPGRFRLKIRPEIQKLDNVPFSECSNTQKKKQKG